MNVQHRFCSNSNGVAIQPGAGFGVKPQQIASDMSGHHRAHRVMRIEYCRISGLLSFKQPRLGSDVVLKGVVTVQMISRDIQACGQLCPEGRNRLQLKTGKLQHIPLIGTGSLDHVRRRRPDVAAYLAGDTRLFENVAGQGGSGCFPIGTGNADHRTL